MKLFSFFLFLLWQSTEMAFNRIFFYLSIIFVFFQWICEQLIKPIGCNSWNRIFDHNFTIHSNQEYSMMKRFVHSFGRLVKVVFPEKTFLKAVAKCKIIFEKKPICAHWKESNIVKACIFFWIFRSVWLHWKISSEDNQEPPQQDYNFWNTGRKTVSDIAKCLWPSKRDSSESRLPVCGHLLQMK